MMEKRLKEIKATTKKIKLKLDTYNNIRVLQVKVKMINMNM